MRHSNWKLTHDEVAVVVAAEWLRIRSDRMQTSSSSRAGNCWNATPTRRPTFCHPPMGRCTPRTTTSSSTRDACPRNALTDFYPDRTQKEAQAKRWDCIECCWHYKQTDGHVPDAQQGTQA